MYKSERKKVSRGIEQRNSRQARTKKLCSVGEALSSLFNTEEYQRRGALASLWRNWDEVLGKDMAPLALPMGHKSDQLIIGAEDNMAMQELTLQTQEILERVNAFMKCACFNKVKVVLLLGQRPLNPNRPQRPVGPLCPKLPSRPPRLGRLEGSFDDESLVGKCYEAYVALFSGPNG